MTPLPSLPVRGPTCPPVVELERVSAGESVPVVAEHLAGCDGCRAHVEELRLKTDAFVRARPPERFLSQLEARARGAPVRRRLLVGALASAAAVVVGAVLLTRGPAQPPVLFKGGLLSIVVKRGGTVRPLKAGDLLQEGDSLRFSMTTTNAGHALVLNRDGRGQVTVVAPFNATAPQVVPAGTTVLEDAAILDATTGRETFVGLFSPTPFEVKQVVRQLETGEAVTCGGCVVEVSTFDKP
jgi:hypothetical protein